MKQTQCWLVVRTVNSSRNMLFLKFTRFGIKFSDNAINKSTPTLLTSTLIWLMCANGVVIDAKEKEKEQKEYSVLKALKSGFILVNFFAVLICFSVVSFNYYMISFYMKYVGGNIFINTILSTISESISNFAINPVQKYMGTKISFIICFALAFALAIPLLFVSNSALIACWVFSAKFFVEAAFMLAYYVNSEVFPPLFVPFSFSVWGLVSRIVTIAAPQIAEVKPRQIPIIIFVVLSGAATAGALMLRKPPKKRKSSSTTTIH
jgi:Na+/melibiose symporter-like transporter